jgi:hypothetical protein
VAALPAAADTLLPASAAPQASRMVIRRDLMEAPSTATLSGRPSRVAGVRDSAVYKRTRLTFVRNSIAVMYLHRRGGKGEQSIHSGFSAVAPALPDPGAVSGSHPLYRDGAVRPGATRRPGPGWYRGGAAFCMVAAG